MRPESKSSAGGRKGWWLVAVLAAVAAVAAVGASANSAPLVVETPSAKAPRAPAKAPPAR